MEGGREGEGEREKERERERERDGKHNYGVCYVEPTTYISYTLTDVGVCSETNAKTYTSILEQCSITTYIHVH